MQLETAAEVENWAAICAYSQGPWIRSRGRARPVLWPLPVRAGRTFFTSFYELLPDFSAAETSPAQKDQPSASWPH